jgi:hypothetical protein
MDLTLHNFAQYEIEEIKAQMFSTRKFHNYENICYYEKVLNIL